MNKGESQVKVGEEKEEKEEEKETGGGEQKDVKWVVDYSSHIMSSHYSILRELRQYVTQFKQGIANEQDMEIVQKHFENIVIVLENACAFLQYPLRNKK